MTQPTDLRRLTIAALLRRRAKLLLKIYQVDAELSARDVPMKGLRFPAMPGPSADILAILEGGETLSPTMIAKRVKRDPHSVRVACTALHKRGAIRRVNHGLYARVEAPKATKARTP